MLEQLSAEERALVTIATANTVYLQSMVTNAEDGKMDEIVKEGNEAIDKNFDLVLAIGRRNGFSVNQIRDLFNESLDRIAGKQT